MPDLEPMTRTVVGILMIGDGLVVVGGIGLMFYRVKESIQPSCCE